MMVLILRPTPPGLRGIYGSKKDHLPERFQFGHPDLVDALQRVKDSGLPIAYSDIFRDAEGSLAARRKFEATGGPQLAKRPGESPHNFGFSVDIDVSYSMKMAKMDKAALDAHLQKCGLWCHRKDHQIAAEAWHYNALGVGSDADQWLKFASNSSTSRAVEAKIQSIYGPQMVMQAHEIAPALKQLGYASVKAFQLDWDLDADNIAGPKTQRLLAYLTATKKLV